MKRLCKKRGKTKINPLKQKKNWTKLNKQQNRRCEQTKKNEKKNWTQIKLNYERFCIIVNKNEIWIEWKMWTHLGASCEAIRFGNFFFFFLFFSFCGTIIQWKHINFIELLLVTTSFVHNVCVCSGRRFIHLCLQLHPDISSCSDGVSRKLSFYILRRRKIEKNKNLCQFFHRITLERWCRLSTTVEWPYWISFALHWIDSYEKKKKTSLDYLFLSHYLYVVAAGF